MSSMIAEVYNRRPAPDRLLVRVFELWPRLTFSQKAAVTWRVLRDANAVIELKQIALLVGAATATALLVLEASQSWVASLTVGIWLGWLLRGTVS